MKFYTNMPKALEPFYKEELLQAKNEFDKKHYPQSWRHLERAHILCQPYPVEHTAVHWKMLGFGIKIKNGKEIIGQIPRLLFGGVKSFVGKIPVGNTGGVNVPPLQPMEIPDDLATIINKSNKAIALL
ncbi:MAG: DUF3703 domain-containing protein [Ferruginibacter sp.]